MTGSRGKLLLGTVILGGWAVSAAAQDGAAPDAPPAPARAASFLPEPLVQTATPDFSGLAPAPPVVQPVAPPPPAAATVAAPVPAAAPAGQPILEQPVASAPLATVSPETIGLVNPGSGDADLGAEMWKGTGRPEAEKLLSMSGVTRSPVLNRLMLRLLGNAAVPPEGQGTGESLTALRVEKLIAFGDAAGAWMLAARADPALIDDATFHLAAENIMIDGDPTVCDKLADYAKTRSSVDWQKLLVVCQLRSKDTKAAQVTLDVLRAQNNRDDMFLEVADKNIIGDGKVLPHQLTPLTAPMLALLRMTGQALPGELYGHPDFSLTPALLRAAAKQDVAQLGLAERAAERGVIGADALVAIYKTISFTPEQLANPLAATESGSRLRALLARAAADEKDPQKRIGYAVKFFQSSSPSFLNGAGSIAADMLGDIKPDASLSENAVTVARIYANAGRGDMAVGWINLARNKVDKTPIDLSDLQDLWPQFVLAGVDSGNDFNSALDKWLDARLKPADAQTDMHPAHEMAAAVLLLLDAAGYTIPDSAWVKAMEKPHNEKHILFSPLLFDRLSAAAVAGRRAETLLLAADLTGDAEISLPVAVSITRALRLVGLKKEATIFARETLALLAKAS